MMSSERRPITTSIALDPFCLAVGTSQAVLRLIPELRRPMQEGAVAPVRKTDELEPLVARCRRGETVATKTLLATLGPCMLQMVRRVLGPAHPDVDDVLQEALIGLLRALPSFRGDSTTRHFACRIATLSAIKARRCRSVNPDDRGPKLDEDCWAGADPHDWALASCRRQILRRLLDELPDPQAEAMVLHCVAGLTVEEIALTSQCPAETVRSRLRLAKAALRERAAADPSMGELLEDSL
jgi:RNA polymerase sigma factor (sigma-70 family)